MKINYEYDSIVNIHHGKTFPLKSVLVNRNKTLHTTKSKRSQRPIFKFMAGKFKYRTPNVVVPDLS